VRPNGSYRDCPVCGKSHYRPRNEDRIRYCSPECYRIGRWGGSRQVTVPCRTCGASITAYASDKRAACSRTCDGLRKSAEKSGANSHLWRGGKTNPYTGTWRAQRALVRQRDKGVCLRCGSTDRPQVHHVVPARYGGTHDLSNLVTLCRSCHSREELKVNAHYRDTLRSRWHNRAA
jgi:5-methylcytosine-specific restriction endonuclease McrA